MRPSVWVQAREGQRFPIESAPRRYITTQAVYVPGTPYYTRAIQDGDLVQVQQLRVRAREGQRFPMEGSRQTIAARPVLVVLTPYYTKALLEGALVQEQS